MHPNCIFWLQLNTLLEKSEIIIERPKNTAHPKYPTFIYPVDYGFLKGTKASDGNEIDIWVGTSEIKEINGILCTIDPIKNDLETKIVYACTDHEISLIYDTMNEVLKAIYIPKKDAS
ncbi:MAG: inorganic diphosphatase [Candidatus Babeliales bacterium]|jgi:inorganic pyrophosphatase